MADTASLVPDVAPVRSDAAKRLAHTRAMRLSPHARDSVIAMLGPGASVRLFGSRPRWRA